MRPILIGIGMVIVVSTEASSQVTLLVRDDMPAAILKVNEPDTLVKAEAQALRINRNHWRHLLREDTTCGGGAVAFASDGREIRYFLSQGKKTGVEANADALRQARAFAAANIGWDVGSLRYWFNKNAYLPDRRFAEDVMEPTAGMDRCRNSFEPNTTMGVRG